jgi:hypothetical protein
MDDLNVSTLVFEQEIHSLRMENESLRQRLDASVRELEREKLEGSSKISKLEQSLKHATEQISQMEAQRSSESARNRQIAEDYTAQIHKLEAELLKHKADALKKLNSDKKSVVPVSDKKDQSEDKKLTRIDFNNGKKGKTERLLKEQFDKLEDFLRKKTKDVVTEAKSASKDQTGASRSGRNRKHSSRQVAEELSDDNINRKKTNSSTKKNGLDEVENRQKSRTAVLSKTTVAPSTHAREIERNDMNNISFGNSNAIKPDLNFIENDDSYIEDGEANPAENKSNPGNKSPSKNQKDKQGTESEDNSEDYFDEQTEIDFHRRARLNNNNNNSNRLSSIKLAQMKNELVRMASDNESRQLLDMVESLQHLLNCEVMEKKSIIEELEKVYTFYEELEAKYNAVKWQLVDAEAIKMDLFSRIDELKDKEHSYEQKMDRLERENKEIQYRIDRLAVNKMDEETETKALRDKITDLEIQLDEARRDLFKQSSLNANLYHDHDAKVRRDRQRYEESQKEIEKLNNRIEQLVAKNKEIYTYAEEIQQRLSDVETSYKDEIQRQFERYEYQLKQKNDYIIILEQKIKAHPISDDVSVEMNIGNNAMHMKLPDNVTTKLGILENMSQMQSLQALNIPESEGMMHDDFNMDMDVPNIEISATSKNSDIKNHRANLAQFDKSSKMPSKWDFKTENVTEKPEPMAALATHDTWNKRLSDIQKKKRGSAFPVFGGHLNPIAEETANNQKPSKTRRSSKQSCLPTPVFEESVMMEERTVNTKNNNRITALIALQNEKYSFQNSVDDSPAENGPDPIVKLLGELNEKIEEVRNLRNKVNICQSLIENQKDEISKLTLKIKHLEEDISNNEACHRKERDYLTKNLEEMTEMFIKEKHRATELASTQDTMTMNYKRTVKNLRYQIDVYEDQIAKHNDTIAKRDSKYKK